MQRLTCSVFLIAFAAAPLTGCKTHRAHTHGKQMAALTSAVCAITPTAGNTASGVIRFTQQSDAVTVHAELSGLAPNSTHAWHVHEFGDITGADGKATGGHYNPEGVPHALPHDAPRHAGDLGNLTADGAGRASAHVTVNNMSIAGLRNAIIGRAVIIHVKPDDGGQPTGNAGARIGQGVIGVAGPAR